MAYMETEVSNETLSKELEIALVDTVKAQRMDYCKSRRMFRVARSKENIPQVILKRGFVCDHIACLHHSTCLAIALKEGLKEDLLEFYRQWGRALSLGKALTIYNK